MSKNLIVLNDAPYGSERTYNGLRLAAGLSRQGGEELRLFLIGDAVACAKSGQKVPEGYYSVETMIGRIARAQALVGVCGTCMDARGLGEAELIAGTHRSRLEDLTAWTQWADKVLAF
jgi:uncharacterized protein involved in oxidation of intracellular sulfur